MVKVTLVTAVIFALFSSAGVHAQDVGANPTTQIVSADSAVDSTALPVWNNRSGKLEAVLLIESPRGIDSSSLFDGAAQHPTFGFGSRWSLANSRLGAGLKLQPQANQLGLVCDGKAAIKGSLSPRCLVTELNNTPSPNMILEGTIESNSGDITASIGDRHSSLNKPGIDAMDLIHSPLIDPSLGLNTDLIGSRVDQQDLGVVGELKLGGQGWVSLGGTLARARLVPADKAITAAVPPQWNTGTIAVGGGFGALGGEVVGRVVQIPGQTESFGSVGLGLTWRTPWQGKLTVGAQNLITRGDNPFNNSNSSDAPREEGSVPYVRYQQDL